MAKKPRKFERKVRGDKKFVKENELLMLNVAKENGLAVWSQVSQSYVVDKITPELIALTKKKKAEAAKIKSGVSDLKTFWENVRKYDSATGANVEKALMMWIEKNPEVSELNLNKRLGVLRSAFKKMRVCMAEKFMASAIQRNPNRFDINGYKNGAPSAKLNTLTKFRG